MALTSVLAARSYSIGPVKQVTGSIAAVSGDTSGTISVPQLTQIDFVEISGGMRLTAAPTIALNVITLAFTDPSTSGWFGSIVIHGK